MTTNSISTIGDVLDYLKNHEAQIEIREVQLGPNEWRVTANNIVVGMVDGKPLLPPSQYSLLEEIVSSLKLERTDNINKQCALNQSTVIIKATVQHNSELVSTLLNFGADPSIADGHGNNAFIYAAESAHSAILKEFLTLIHEDAPAKQQHKKADAVPEQKAPAAQIQKTETVSSPRADLQPPKKSQEAPTTRVKLDPKVLLITNAIGETAEHLMKVYREKHRAVRDAAEAKLNEDLKQKAAKLSGRSAQVKPRQPVNHVESFKKLVDEVHQIQKNKQAQVTATVVKAEQREAPAVKPLMDESRNAYADKVNKILNLYNKFLVPKLTFFSSNCKAAVMNDPDQTKLALARETVRFNVGEEVHYIRTSVPFPPYFKDQAKVKAALALLKDYYAPESAPVSRFFQWGALRRLLTFHMGRRYCVEAEALHTELQACPLKSVDDIMKVIGTLETNLEKMLTLTHDKKNKNSIFNSSYTRRLFYIIEQLKSTKAYEYAVKFQPTDTAVLRTAYLNELDVNNMVAGIIPFSTQLPKRP